MTWFRWGCLVWLPWAGYFVVFELPAAAGRVFGFQVPWPTLSSYVKNLEGRWVWGCFFILVGLTILNIHLVGSFLPKLYREITG